MKEGQEGGRESRERHKDGEERSSIVFAMLTEENPIYSFAILKIKSGKTLRKGKDFLIKGNKE